jgi:fatty acid desaturase
MLESPTKSFDPYTRFRKALLTSDEVKELSQLSPLRPILDVAFLWLQILTAWWVVSIWTHWWVVLLAIPFIGTRSYALHTIGHDGVHRRILPNSWANDLFNDIFIYGTEGAITRINGQNHLNHHRFLATDADPDRHKYASANKTTRFELITYLCGLSALVPLWRNVFTREKSRNRSHQERQRAGYSARDLFIIGACQSLLLGGLTWAIGWWAYPILWLLPVYVFTFCGDLIRFFLEHSHPEPDEIADERRLMTYYSNPIERVFLSPKNINLHIAHHLWPSIPYYNLPRADAIIRYRKGSDNLIWRSTYLEALVQYYRALPIPECRRPVPPG